MISIGIEFHNLGAVAEYDLSKNDVLDLGTAKEPLDADRRLRLCTSYNWIIRNVQMEAKVNFVHTSLLKMFLKLKRML